MTATAPPANPPRFTTPATGVVATATAPLESNNTTGEGLSRDDILAHFKQNGVTMVSTRTRK